MNIHGSARLPPLGRDRLVRMIGGRADPLDTMSVLQRAKVIRWRKRCPISPGKPAFARVLPRGLEDETQGCAPSMKPCLTGFDGEGGFSYDQLGGQKG